MNTCSSEESEAFRVEVLNTNTASRNIQVKDSARWVDGWKTGLIMKFAPIAIAEYKILKEKIFS